MLAARSAYSPEGIQFARGDATADQDLHNTYSDDTVSDYDYEHDISPASSRLSRSSFETEPFDDDEADGVVKTVEHKGGYGGTRDFSNMTAFNLRYQAPDYGPVGSKRCEDRGVSSSIEPLKYDSDTTAQGVFEALYRLRTNSDIKSQEVLRPQSRGAPVDNLDTYSALPEENASPKAFVSSQGTQRRKRHTLSTNQRETIRHAHFSSEEDDEFRTLKLRSRVSTPVKDIQPSSSPLKSSVLSPSPFSTMRRSIRRDRGLSATPSNHSSPSRQSTRSKEPSHSPPVQHPSHLKEYPLVLLQCTISSAELPYPDEVLRRILPQRAKQDLLLLHRKLTKNVLERGVLMAHPGDDYELLEERILESLELKSPRIGQCGHFLGRSLEDMDDGYTEESFGFPSPHGCKCEDCGDHLTNAVAENPRWYIKVYAANGLMTAGAWAASWRQMERADVEIGIHVPDMLRQSLEEEQSAFEDSCSVLEPAQAEPGYPVMSVQTTEPLSTDPTISQTRHASGGCSTGRRPNSQKGPLPLSTLLLNYVKRQSTRLTPSIGHPRQSILFPALVGLLFLCVALLIVTSPVQQLNFRDGGYPGNPSSLAADMILAVPTLVAEDASGSDDVASGSFPICVFPIQSAAEHRMTALPEHIAKKVMESWKLMNVVGDSTPTAMPEVEKIVIGDIPASEVSVAEKNESGDLSSNIDIRVADIVAGAEENVEEV